MCYGNGGDRVTLESISLSKEWLLLRFSQLLPFGNASPQVSDRSFSVISITSCMLMTPESTFTATCFRPHPALQIYPINQFSQFYFLPIFKIQQLISIPSLLIQPLIRPHFNPLSMHNHNDLSKTQFSSFNAYVKRLKELSLAFRMKYKILILLNILPYLPFQPHLLSLTHRIPYVPASHLDFFLWTNEKYPALLCTSMYICCSLSLWEDSGKGKQFHIYFFLP